MNISLKHMISKLPHKKCPQQIDVVFEGGLFNGGYLLGILYYLKELESSKYILIKRFSGCSIGSLIPLIYYTEAYHLSDIIYKITYKHFKKECNIDIFPKLFDNVRPFLTEDVMKRLNGNLFITYYNIQTNTQIVKNTYKNVDDLLNTIHKSCYVPYVVDNCFLYKNKYVDGFYPFVFPVSKNTKILYLNIHKFDKLFNMICIKNEKTNHRRILEGIIDIHIFFTNNVSTSICSYVNNWTFIDRLQHFIFVFLLQCIPYFLHKLFVLHKMFVSKIKGLTTTPKKNKDKYDTFYSKVLHWIYVSFIKTFCV